MTTRFCPRCRAAHEAGRKCPKSVNASDQQRGSFRDRGYTSTWDKFRVIVLREEPFCRHCMADGKLTPAALVDHIVPLAAGGELLSRENTQPLCVRHHAVKTEADKRKYPEVYR